MRGGLPLYRIEDYNGEELKGTFYQQELQRITVETDKLWKVEKILKSRKSRGKKEHLVRWMHWPKKFDSWVEAKDIKSL